MKKIVLVFSCILILLFISFFIIVFNDDSNIDKLKKKIIENTDITFVTYINYYDNHYIVRDSENLYLIDSEYNEILSINLSLLFNKYENYDIVYRNKTLMYMEEYKDKKGIIFKYYDIYTGECIDSLLIGGFDE